MDGSTGPLPRKGHRRQMSAQPSVHVLDASFVHVSGICVDLKPRRKSAVGNGAGNLPDHFFSMLVRAIFLSAAVQSGVVLNYTV